MIIYAPFYTVWTEQNINFFIQSFNRKYLSRDKDTCNELYQAAIRAGKVDERNNNEHVAYPLIIERVP